jgi:uncharacterized cupredoxin-like copper-binding protein
MRLIIVIFLVAVGGCSAHPPTSSGLTTAAVSGEAAVTVLLSSFAFDPERIRLKAGEPVRLRLVSESGGGHNFSAPAFFAESSFLPGSSAPAGGEIEVGPHQKVEVSLVPRQPGTYPLTCTHSLHDLFGMTGSIDVVP